MASATLAMSRSAVASSSSAKLRSTRVVRGEFFFAWPRAFPLLDSTMAVDITFLA